MRLRIAYTMELTLAFAVGLAVARTVPLPRFIGQGTFLKMLYLTGPALSGMALVEGLSLWLELARRRGPSAWGIGRWTWSIMAALIILDALEIEANLVGEYMRMISMGAPNSARNSTAWWRSLIGGISSVTPYRSHWVPLALWITARTARLPGGGRADGREWSGRIFAGCFVGWWIVYRLIGIGPR